MKSAVIPTDVDLPAIDVQSGRLADGHLLENSSQAIPSHPLGVKPSGNMYTAATSARHSIGNFQRLPDEILATFLEYLDANLLCLLGSTCRFLYAFCRTDDVWKQIFITSHTSKLGSFCWRGTWRSTMLGLTKEQSSNIWCDNVFSDVLYRPFLCTHTSLVPYTTNMPRRNQITRFENLSQDDFLEHWSDKPFILTQPVRDWPVFRSWDTDILLEKYGSIKFRAEAVDWTLKSYVAYMRNNNDESPLYLFDRSFVKNMNLTVGRHHESPSYWPPECFGEDLFAVLGDNRPDDKWLIIGPARSGSTYHKDPNATSAWNAVLRGSKYWIMFPSGRNIPPPPGVFVSEDQSEVTSPLSIAEWLLEFHAAARNTPGCIEAVCMEGEVLHVPSGWWHLVVNLDTSIAITQNFVPRSHLAGVLSFLRDKPDQVSGFKDDVTDPFGMFVERMQRELPGVLDRGLERLAKMSEGRKRKWDAVIEKTEVENKVGGFTFGFGGDGDDSDAGIP
ncbi:putative F-box and JmjC domain protein [Xylogone sp. PMI_703]|nr:putative F-box and JmjC domain protein [Xylogone sp. PMI_703]